jgi:hypothetical protein
MRSTGNYPVFEDKRNEMDVRPLRYRQAVGRATYRFEDWKERRFDQKHAAMIAQKREPFLNHWKA